MSHLFNIFSKKIPSCLDLPDYRSCSHNRKLRSLKDNVIVSISSRLKKVRLLLSQCHPIVHAQSEKKSFHGLSEEEMQDYDRAWNPGAREAPTLLPVSPDEVDEYIAKESGEDRVRDLFFYE